MTFGKLLERLLHLVPVLLGVSVIVFLMITLTPGDPVEIMLGDQKVTPEQEAALRHDMGLDRPLLERFGVFLGNALQGDFGRSFFHRRPVGEVIAERLPATIELSLVALLIALLTAIPLGVLAAVRKNTILDRIATVGSLLGVSMPGFWFGILLIMLFAVQLQVLPVSGRIGYAAEVPAITHLLLVDTLLAGRLDSFVDALAHILLPAITLALPMAAILMRVTRSSMLEVSACGLHRLRRGQGPVPRAHPVPPRAQERADPDRDGRGARDRLAARRQHDRRDGVRLAGPRPARGREHLRPQLPARAGGGAALCAHLCAPEFRRRHSLHVLNPRVRPVSALLVGGPCRRRGAESPLPADLRQFLRTGWPLACDRHRARASCCVAIFAPLVAPHDPYESRPAAPAAAAGLDGGRRVGLSARLRRARPRHPLAPDLRRARLDLDRLRGGRHRRRRSARRSASPPAISRGWIDVADLAPRRHPARLPLPDLRDRR